MTASFNPRYFLPPVPKDIPSIDYAQMDATQLAPLLKGNRVRQEEYLKSLDSQIATAKLMQDDPLAQAQAYADISQELHELQQQNPDEVRFNEELQERYDYIKTLPKAALPK